MRLTISKRDTIKNEESTKKFHDKLNEAKKQFVLAVEEEVEKHVPKITEELKDYVYTCNGISIEGLKRREMPESYMYNCYPQKTNGSDSIKYTSKIKKKVEAFGKIENEKHVFEKDLRLVLSSYTTSKQLIAVIPEFKIYFKDEATSNALVPIEHIKRVRKSLFKEKK